MEWPLLNGLDAALRRRVLAAAQRRVFRRNEVIWHEGDPGDTLHMLLKGHVAIRVATALGERVTLMVLGPGEAFGEFALVNDEAARTATAAAIESAETMALHRRDFEAFRRSEPMIDRMLIAALAARVQRLSTHLVEALNDPVEVRLMRRLLDLHASYGGESPVSVPLTQDDLASLAGTTRPTANRILRELEGSGTIAISRGRVDILDPDHLSRQSR